MWQSKLSKSANEFMQEIVNQIPEEHGARAAFESILDQLAGQESRWLILDDYGNAYETSEEETAEHAGDQDYQVIAVHEKYQQFSEDEEDDE